MAAKLTPGQKLDALIAKAAEMEKKIQENAKAKGIEEDDIDWEPLWTIAGKMEELVSSVTEKYGC